MKIKKSILQITGIIVLLLAVQFELYACPKCNQDFYQELLGERGKTLGGQELLEAIRNQSISGEPTSLVLPAAYNSETDIKQSNIQDTSDSDEINDVDNSISVLPTSYAPYIIMIAQFISLSS